MSATSRSPAARSAASRLGVIEPQPVRQPPRQPGDERLAVEVAHRPDARRRASVKGGFGHGGAGGVAAGGNVAAAVGRAGANHGGHHNGKNHNRSPGRREGLLPRDGRPTSGEGGWAVKLRAKLPFPESTVVSPPDSPRFRGKSGREGSAGADGPKTCSTPPETPLPHDAPPLNVALLGLGTVGAGVARLLLEQPERLARRAGRPMRLCRAVVRDTARDRDLDLHGTPVGTDPAAAVADLEVDVVVEVMGGFEPAAPTLPRRWKRASTSSRRIRRCSAFTATSCFRSPRGGA